MTNKEYVLSINPNLKSEKQRTIGFGAHTYWLIREKNNTMYFAEGNTEAQAWKAAKEKLLEIEAYKKKI